MRKMTLLSALLLFSYGLQAQEVETGYLTEAIITPQFFITVIAGVILALGFQFILTALSVATGISAIGDVKKSYVQGKNHTAGKHSFGDDSGDDDDDSNSGSTAVKVTAGFGIWSTITVAISLFAATALALNLSMIANTMVGITLALVIWATFFILLFYLESKVVNTLVGGLINTATAGLRSSAEAVKGMFATSKEKKIQNMADHTIEKVREEFQSPIDEDSIHRSIDDFFTRFDQKMPDYQKVKQDIEEIVNNSVEKSNENSNQNNSGGSSPMKWMAVQNVISTAIDSSSKDSSPEGKGKTEQLKQLQKELKEAYAEGDTNEEKAKKVIAKLTPAEEEQVGEYMTKIKDMLSSNGSSSMSESDLKNRINEIIKDPKVEAQKLGGKLGELDRNEVISFLSSNTSLSRMEIEKYADKVEKVVRTIQIELSGNTNDSMLDDLKAQVQKLISGIGSSNGESTQDFSGLGSMLQAKLESQKGNLSTMKQRLKNYDREQIIATVTNNTRIDRKDIDKVVDTIEDSKNKALKKIDKIENSAKAKLATIERKAVIKAEHTRKTAASAAWWLVVSAVVSAGAAIAGSMLTVF
ncbi:hypothetical protein [Christiangramia aquimixticola]|uniref:hypothetical protein n=1 Tax=Christiangramia aquimixticola TaxID=1697558 RepID=UPI003AA7B6C3